MCKVLSFRITGKECNFSPRAKALPWEVRVENSRARRCFATSHHLRATRGCEGCDSWSPIPRCWRAGTESRGVTSPRCSEPRARRSPSASNTPRKPRRNCCFPSSPAPGRALASPHATEAWLERDYCDSCPFLSSRQKAPFIWANFEGRTRGIGSMNWIWVSRPHLSKPHSLASPSQGNRYLSFGALEGSIALILNRSIFAGRGKFKKSWRSRAGPFSQQKTRGHSKNWGEKVVLVCFCFRNQHTHLHLPKLPHEYSIRPCPEQWTSCLVAKHWKKWIF